MASVYLISGPAGVGKSTTSKSLVRSLSNSAYISGDAISHMHINGRQKPWESKMEIELIWNNILGLTENFLRSGIDVVIDYVAFPHEAVWLKKQLQELTPSVKYVVLWTDEQTLLSRDKLRLPEHQMKERCLVLMKEFQESGIQTHNMLNTSQQSTDDINQVVYDILNNSQFLVD